MGRFAVAENELEVDLPQTETSIRRVAKKLIKLKKNDFFLKTLFKLTI